MIDIHTHILFGVDDGCNTIEQSIRSLKRAGEVGVTDVFLTPHYALRRMYNADKKAIQENFLKLQKEIQKQKININIYLGTEIDEEDGFIERLEEGVTLTMNQTKYVLLDFAMRETEVDDILYELKIRGYIPIVAHPERYKYVDIIKSITKWKATGALIQLNASSLFSTPEVKKKARYIIKHKLADFIASDSHCGSEDYQKFEKAYTFISKKSDTEYRDNLFIHNPRKLIQS